MKPTFHALILAAEKGTGFKSYRIRVLHPLLGKSMLRLVVDSVSRLNPKKIFLFVDYQKEEVIRESWDREVDFISTFEAAAAALAGEIQDDILILNGDLPLLTPKVLRPLLDFHRREKNDLSIMSAGPDLSRGQGRILTDADKETFAQQKSFEPTTAVCVCRVEVLLKTIARFSSKVSFFSFDIVRQILSSQLRVGVYQTRCCEDVLEVKDRQEFSRAIAIMRLRKIESLSRRGVTFFDPASTWIDLDVKIGRDSTIYPFVILEGRSVVGKQCTLYPGTHLVDSFIGNNVKVLSSTMIEASRVEDDVQVGPFTHLRPNTVLKKGAKVGNFVEMKNTVFGAGSKAGHLSYVGDSQVGKDVNIGAGTITCNYDGIKKSKTKINDGAFIGSGTQLIAPVTIGSKSYVGAGSTITKDVSPESLAVSRAKQVEKKGWARRKRKK